MICEVCKEEINATRSDGHFVYLSFNPIKAAHPECAPALPPFRDNRHLFNPKEATAEEFPEFTDDLDFFDSVKVIDA